MLPNNKIDACKKCNGSEFETNDQGFTSCVDCGLVRQQIKFDDNVNFGSGKEMQGKNVDAKDKQHQQSSEKRLRRVRQRIEVLCKQLDINETYSQAIQASVRLIKYADNCNFFKKGKNIELYAAAALYITLRFKKAPFLLIDFSDKLDVNLFKLARCYLKLSKKFGFQEQLPLIDPSLFIHRYCKLLNLGDKTKDVTMTAIRLIKRMKRDWMCQGRRPSSLCGAAILIATKIHKVNNPNCSTTEICKTVFVCDETIRRRLDEFKRTKVSKLTPEQFQKDDKVGDEDVEMDPPAFRKARLRSQHESEMMKEAALHAEIQKAKLKWDGEQDVPQQIIRQYSDQIAKKYQMASDRVPPNQNFRIDEQNFMEELQENQSNNTGGAKNIDSEEESENSSIDEKMVFLDEKQQKQRKEIWENQNRGWLDKQMAKVQRGEVKKKTKAKKHVEPAVNLYEAVRNTSLGAKADEEELKKLLSSQPKLKQKDEQPIVEKSLGQIFNPFRWNKL